MERLTIMTEKGAALNVTATTEEEARKQVHDMFLQVLADYYEIEERQEQGCGFCKDDAHVRWYDSTYCNYCPMCGRKLVE